MIHDHDFHGQMEAMEKMLLFLDNSSSVHIIGINKSILARGEDPTQGLKDAKIIKCPITFTESEKRFVLSLHYIGSNSFLFFNIVKINKFRAKDSEIKPYPLCLSNILKGFTLDNMKNRIKRE